MLPFLVHLHTAVLVTAHRLGARTRGDDGQTTAEYALVLLGAAAVAMLLVTWASKTDVLGTLFNFVLDKVMGFLE